MRLVLFFVFFLFTATLFSQIPDYIYKGVDVAKVTETKKSGGIVKAEVYNSAGQKLLEAYFKKNRETGHWKKFRPNGNLYYTYSYRKGKLQGWTRYYDENGRIGYKENYSLGMKYGTYKSYHSNGQISCKTHYRPVPFLRYDFIVTLPQDYPLDLTPPPASAKIGKETCYYESGKVKARKYYDYGYIREFDWISTSDGEKKGYYEIRDVDIRTGKWLFFDEKGKITRTEDYEKNKLMRSESIKE